MSSLVSTSEDGFVLIGRADVVLTGEVSGVLPKGVDDWVWSIMSKDEYPDDVWVIVGTSVLLPV
jgi:hypothetical protein